MTTYRFTEVTHHATKNTKCTGCGKRLRRQRKFGQTLNPYNKAADGRPKNEQQIRAELAESAAAWKEQPETCADCD